MNEKTLERLSSEGHVFIEKNYDGKHYSYLIQDRYGICKMRCSLYRKGSKLTIKAAVNKTEYFINQANEIHNSKYDYSLVQYVDNKNKVKIICPQHGIFEQLPTSHIQGNNCLQCYYNSLKMTKEDFVKKANIRHNNYYNYDEIIYNNNETTSKSKIEQIKCTIHGFFSQLCNDHLNGSGCPYCARFYQGWDFKVFNNCCVKNNNGLGTFYILRCWNETEEFYKLGITSKSILKRYSGNTKLPYKYEIIQEITDIPENVLKFEGCLKKYIKQQNIYYTPQIKFEGCVTECFYFNKGNLKNGEIETECFKESERDLL